MISFKQFISEQVFINSKRLLTVRKASENRHKKLQAQHPQDKKDKVLGAYVNSGPALNSALLGHINKSPELDDYDEKLSSRFENNHPTNRKLIVYHGANFNPSDFPKNKEGHHVIDNPSYLSTSSNYGIADGFSKKHILRIHVPKHSNVLVMPHDEDSEYGDEHEILIHKGHTLHVDSKPIDVKDKDIKNRTRQVWNARLIYDGTG